MSGMTWNNSRLACQRYGGDLVVIRNQSEQDFLARSMTPSQKLQHYWIGLTDVAKEGRYIMYQHGLQLKIFPFLSGGMSLVGLGWTCQSQFFMTDFLFFKVQ